MFCRFSFNTAARRITTELQPKQNKKEFLFYAFKLVDEEDKLKKSSSREGQREAPAANEQNNWGVDMMGFSGFSLGFFFYFLVDGSVEHNLH